MHGVVGIHRTMTVCRLLEAAEVSFVAEAYLARLVFFYSYVASPHVVAGESIIQNILDLVVLFRVRVTGRVQIQSVGDLRVQHDEDVAFAAQNNSNIPN